MHAVRLRNAVVSCALELHEQSQAPAGVWGFRAAWLYGAACSGIVLVRTLKRVVFFESRQYSVDASRHNYLLLGLWLFQFPFTWWLAARR